MLWSEICCRSDGKTGKRCQRDGDNRRTAETLVAGVRGAISEGIVVVKRAWGGKRVRARGSGERTGSVVEGSISQFVVQVPLGVCVLQQVLNVLHMSILAGREDGILIGSHFIVMG